MFLPSCGESIELLDNTFRCVSGMRWHGTKTVYVLDDSAREEVRALAARYGYRYVVRANRGELRKAGNLINAFGLSDGEFIVVLDADFAVRPDFLYETMPYTADPKVGIVQTAQFFDTRNRSFSYIQRYSGALQEIFFRFIQPSRDRYKAAICAGTNLVYRRSAVDAAGGFARVPIGEDVHSGVKLWWAGDETRYVPLCLAKGVAPGDFASLANQQTRWCRSSMLLMVEKHFREAPFTWKQRVAFWAAFLYYMSSAALLFTAPFPTLIDDVVLPAAGLPAQLPGHTAFPGGDLVRVPHADQWLAPDYLPGLRHKFLLSPVCDLVCDPRPRRGVGADRCIPRPGSGSHGGEPDPAHLDRDRADAAVVIAGAAAA